MTTPTTAAELVAAAKKSIENMNAEQVESNWPAARPCWLTCASQTS